MWVVEIIVRPTYESREPNLLHRLMSRGHVTPAHPAKCTRPASTRTPSAAPDSLVA